MEFKYQISGSGWADCEIRLDLHSYYFRASYHTDALGDILNSLLKINPLYTEEVYIEHGTQFFFDNEPSGTEWFFKYIGNDKMLMKITSFTDIDSSEGEKLDINTQCSYEEFLLLVIRESEKLLNEYGIVGYKEMWIEHEFPISSFLRLKYFLNSKTKFPIETKECGYKEYYNSNLKMELEYLLK